MVHIFYQDSRQTFWIVGANLHEMPIVGPIVQQKMASASPTTVPFFIDGTCLPDAVAWGHAPLLMAAVAVLQDGGSVVVLSLLPSWDCQKFLLLAGAES
jgi:hypothetical protein